MDLQTRKIEFVQAFLKLQSEELISEFEKLLRNVKQLESDKDFEPFTAEELNERILQSEKDFENNKFKTTAKILSKY
ncbi:hypothetical protein MG290_07465 [Flavobacterium sp. CBA20B-1]|uniref:hypothetical protein n=1 Tax=unclassified Flavobacterium TaxID=196869 RepID=UPI002224A3DF|nr:MULTISPECIES: hypothetical protein [unclassified Flavobacterium]WCM40816.1 hypothetical protein MG290_07465 [Flavobacterium sp. CBA20B-1]